MRRAELAKSSASSAGGDGFRCEAGLAQLSTACGIGIPQVRDVAAAFRGSWGKSDGTVIANVLNLNEDPLGEVAAAGARKNRWSRYPSG
jgi:hypothetical protein